MLEFNWSDVPSFQLNETILQDWLTEVCLLEKKKLGEVAVVFCSDDELLEMNRSYLNHDYFTDIITFDYCENDLIHGDLFISVDRVKDNAKGLNIGFLVELSRVMVHGVLHLCGYGDKSDDEKTLMREKEDCYLNKLKGFT